MGGDAGKTAFHVATLGTFAAADYLMGEVKDMFKGPEVPDAPIPDAPVQKGEEGIRRGEMQKQSKRRALGQAYLTKGQDRSGATLGDRAQTLG